MLQQIDSFSYYLSSSYFDEMKGLISKYLQWTVSEKNHLRPILWYVVFNNRIKNKNSLYPNFNSNNIWLCEKVISDDPSIHYFYQQTVLICISKRFIPSLMVRESSSKALNKNKQICELPLPFIDLRAI